MDSTLWYKEILSIKIPNLLHKDMTKILLLFYITKENAFNKEVKISDFNEFVYRFYIDNEELAKCHPSIVVNSLQHYGTKDLLPFTKQALEEWKNDFKDGCLINNESSFKIMISDFNINVMNYTKNIAEMLYVKATNKKYDYNEAIESFNDYNLELINNSRLKNRVFEDMQYCVCCDDIYDLRIINLSNDIKHINNKFNYVTVCPSHYNLFLEKYFSFDSMGFIKIYKESKLLNYKMHLSNQLLNSERRKILNLSDDLK